MEELKSTEVLDQEILEDARKRAFKILKTADDTLEQQKRDWDKKIRDAVDSIRNIYSERLDKMNAEIYARLPLDKRRLRSETAESFIGKTMDDFLLSLGRDALLSVLEQALAGRLASCAKGELGGKALIRYSGMSMSEARELLAKLSVPGDFEFEEDAAGVTVNDGEFPAVHKFPAMVINYQSLRISSSVKTAADALLKEKRAELAAALLGEGVLDD